MKGAFVNMKQDDNGSPEAPQDYIEDSLKMISEAGLDHARFLFYWEAYERDPDAFMKEIKSVAEAADKYGVKIIYDNHQWHTSSWLEDRGTGFPWSLFEGEYSKGGGGNTQDKAAQVFWADWWDRSVKDKDGKDGWVQMAEFLKKIVLTVDNHSSTLGYEILSEPHVDDTNQWSQIGKFNSFITEALRDITSKTIVYSMNVPVDLNSQINISPENLAKMAPSNKDNIAFKISVYGVPDRDDYQKERFDLFLDTRNLTGVPLYIGEWNNVVRTKEGGVFKINPGASDFTKSNAEKILDALKKEGVWGTAFWKWDYRDADTASFNLVSDENGKLVPTEYFGILEDSVEDVYGSSDGVSTSDVSTTGDTSTSTPGDTSTSDVSTTGDTSTSTPGDTSTSDVSTTGDTSTSTPGDTSTSTASTSGDTSNSTPGDTSTSTASTSDDTSNSTPGDTSTSNPDDTSTSTASTSGDTSTSTADDTSTSAALTSSDTSTFGDTSMSAGKETNLINELVKTGKFTESEAKQFASKSIQNRAGNSSTSDNTQSDNTQSSNSQFNNNDQSSNASSNNPEQYDDFNDLINDIKNHIVDMEDISLNAFQDSGAYQGADEETQDCIDLAGKIGNNLGDHEIVNCFEDPNFYKNQISNADNNNIVDDTVN
jgi:polyhydroxyalkanoate synthesis regulator phasin